MTAIHHRRMLVLFIIYLGICISGLRAQQYAPPSNDAEFERQYQERIKKDRLSGIYIPKNLEDALTQLNKLSSEDSKNIFRAIPEDSVCQIMHNRLGQWMIVNWSFYEGSRLSNYLRSAGVSYPDDMADFLLLAFHRQLNHKSVEIRELATYFREKRKAERKEELKEAEILKEETRKRPRPDTLKPAAEPVKQPEKTNPKGGGNKQ